MISRRPLQFEEQDEDASCRRRVAGLRWFRIVTFESNGLFVLARGNGVPRLVLPGFRDIRGYQAMYRDFYEAITNGHIPQMSLERAIEDQRLMDGVYSSLQRTA